MKKKIIAGSEDVGGANSLVSCLQKLNWDNLVKLMIIGYGPALEIFKSKNFSTHGLSELSLEGIDSLINSEKPDLIFTGSSSTGGLDKFLIYCARKIGIPSISILDTYGNYIERVSGNENNEKFKFMPDKMCIMDHLALEEMVRLGFDQDRLIVTGQPFFDNLTELRIKHRPEDTFRIRNELRINQNNYLVLFVSQYLDALIKENPKYDSGYTEVSVLRELYNAMKRLKRKNLTLLVKIHPSPKEDINNTKKAIEFPLPEHQILFLKDTNTRHHILASDLVAGMFSTSLIEAVYLGKTAISIQPNLNRADNLLTNYLGITLPIYKTEEIFPTLEKVIEDENYKQNFKEGFLSDGKSTERVTNLIYSTLGLSK